MKISLLSYNLNHNKALGNVPELVEGYEPDIIALQETDTMSLTRIKRLLPKYEVVGLSHSFLRTHGLFGVVTLAKLGKFERDDNLIIDLPIGIWELITLPFYRLKQRRTVLKSNLKTKDGTAFSVCNVHLSPYSLNSLRIKQIKKTLNSVELFTHPPIIVTGDFNYPYKRKSLETLFQAHGLTEATTNVFHTFKSNLRLFPFKLKLDYILYKGIKHIKTEQIPVRYSDHFPLYSEFEL